MLHTAVLEPFLVLKTEEQNREETVKECIDKIRPLSSDFQELLNHQDKSFFQKVKSTLVNQGSFIGYLCVFFALGFFYIFLIGDKKENMNTFTISLLLSIALVNFCWVFKTIGFDLKSLIDQEINNKDNIIKFFSVLADKKFEIRGELLENYSKLKLIIEENQYIEGTSSVIKNSSKSLTSYINLTEDKESIIRSVVAIVKESEKKFN